MAKTRKGRECACEQGIQSPTLQIALVFFQWLYNAETILEGIMDSWLVLYLGDYKTSVETHLYAMDRIEHHSSRWSLYCQVIALKSKQPHYPYTKQKLWAPLFQTVEDGT